MIGTRSISTTAQSMATVTRPRTGGRAPIPSTSLSILKETCAILMALAAARGEERTPTLRDPSVRDVGPGDA